MSHRRSAAIAAMMFAGALGLPLNDDAEQERVDRRRESERAQSDALASSRRMKAEAKRSRKALLRLGTQGEETR
jgi:hypothetical protein